MARRSVVDTCLLKMGMKSANAYPYFDADIHCVFVLWKKSFCSWCSLNRTTLGDAGTEESQPTHALFCPKKKRNPNKWKRNIKRKRSNEGERYEGTVKKSDKKTREIIEEKLTRAGCMGKCRMNCTEIYGENEIFNEFQKLPSITEKRHFTIQRVKTVRKEKNKETESQWKGNEYHDG